MIASKRFYRAHRLAQLSAPLTRVRVAVRAPVDGQDNRQRLVEVLAAPSAPVVEREIDELGVGVVVVERFDALDAVALALDRADAEERAAAAEVDRLLLAFDAAEAAAVVAFRNFDEGRNAAVPIAGAVAVDVPAEPAAAAIPAADEPVAGPVAGDVVVGGYDGDGGPDLVEGAFGPCNRPVGWSPESELPETTPPPLPDAAPPANRVQRGLWAMLKSVMPEWVWGKNANQRIKGSEVKAAFVSKSYDDEPEIDVKARSSLFDVLASRWSGQYRKYHRASNRWHSRLRLLREMREELLFESAEIRRERTPTNEVWVGVVARKVVDRYATEGKVERRHKRWFRACLVEVFFVKDDDDTFLDAIRGSLVSAY